MEQLGLYIKIKQCLPTRIQLSEPILSVNAGLRHTLALTITGKVMGWVCIHSKKFNSKGCNRHFHLDPVLKGNLLPFTLPFSDVISMDAGQFHSAILSKTNLHTFGSNKHKQLCSLNASDTQFTLEFKDDILLSVHCGWNHTIIRFNNGMTKCWGRNDHGQLCVEGKITSELECGSEHNICITSGHASTFGWNEHGNCGTGEVQDVTNVHAIQFAENVVVHKVGCGAGNSFIICLEPTDSKEL